MDPSRFDDLTRTFASGMSRRQVLKLFAGSVLAGVGTLVGGPSRVEAIDDPNHRVSSCQELLDYIDKRGFYGDE
jgi:hypothetical protein